MMSLFSKSCCKSGAKTILGIGKIRRRRYLRDCNRRRVLLCCCRRLGLSIRNGDWTHKTEGKDFWFVFALKISQKMVHSLV